MYEEQTIFASFNARHLSARQIAESFVPPINIFADLAATANHILTGPRGSGKTTLLRMLTIPALAMWDHIEADQIRTRANYLGVFIPADRNWHGQLKAVQDYSKDEEDVRTIGVAAFTTHVLKALVNTFQDISEFATSKISGPLQGELVTLTAEQERDLARQIAKAWQLELLTASWLGLQTSLSQRLVKIGSIRNGLNIMGRSLIKDNDFLFLDYRESVRFAVELHNAFSGRPKRKWCLMFDELEIAPSAIQRELLADLRGSSAAQLITYKLALAPYNRNFHENLNEFMATTRNDFHHLTLTYARKDDGYLFSKQLVETMLRLSKLPEDDARSLLGESAVDFGDDETVSAPYTESGLIGKSVKSLAAKDPTFRDYLKKRGLKISQFQQLSENDKAQSFRKIRSIVLVRDHFSRAIERNPSTSPRNTNHALEGASRKSYELYTGFPSMLALAEGNPRWVIGMFAPLIQQLGATRMSNARAAVSKEIQSQEIRDAIRALRSLLRTIPYQVTDGNNRGLLRFLDQIGAYFHAKCVLEPFREQPPLTFTVDSNADRETLGAVGRALNVGAIIYIPDRQSDDVLTSLSGKKFRLSYLLAAYYKIPLILNTPIALSTILKANMGGKSNDTSAEDQAEFTFDV